VNNMIIDAHAHLGHDYVFDLDATEEQLLSDYRRFGVDGAIVQPFISRTYIKDTAEIHDRIAKFCSDYPGKFWGMASINPHFTPEDYEKEAKRCIKKLGFIAIKITPFAHACDPSSTDGMHVFEVARELGVPVMVHTGAGIPFSDPISILPAAKAFSDIKIVLAHAGTDTYFAQALFLAKEFDNVYLEPSWLGIHHVMSALKTIGAGKMMFSSDHSINVPVELAKYRTAIEDKMELEKVMSGTAAEVFNLFKK